MNIFKTYIDYLKDNPQGYWFKRKVWGWGWTPALWQGWAVLAVSVLYIVWVAVNFAQATRGNAAIPNGEVFLFIFQLIIAFLFIISMCYWKGEKPRWQWGVKSNNK